MKKILALLFAPLLAFAQTNVQKAAGGNNTLTNGSIVVGNNTTITTSGNGSISGNIVPTSVPWSVLTAIPSPTFSHTGDATGNIVLLAGGGATGALTLATVNSNVGTFAGITLNGKGLATAAVNLTITTTAPLTGGGVLGNLTIAMPAATTSVSGYLTSADWNTFNGKQAAGNYITALTGDGTAAGPGSVAFTLATVATGATTGSSTAIPVVTFNNKGLVTAITTAAVVAPAGTLTGTTIASNVIASSLTSVGTSLGINTGGPAASGMVLQTVDTGTASPRGITADQYNNGTNSAQFNVRKARGTFATPLTIVTGDVLGRYIAWGHDGTNFIETGNIRFTSAGTVATTRVPSQFEVWTSTDAAPSVLTQALVIDKTQAITVGTWNATVIAGLYGGTGVANSGKTITLGGNFTTSGAFAVTQTYTGTTNVTFPTSGTLLTSAGAVTSITGTSGQITASASTGSVTLSIPSAMTGINSIATVASTNLTLTTAGINGLVFTHGSDTAATVVADFTALTKVGSSTSAASIIGTSLGLTGKVYIGGDVNTAAGIYLAGDSSSSKGSIIPTGTLANPTITFNGGSGTSIFRFTQPGNVNWAFTVSGPLAINPDSANNLSFGTNVTSTTFSSTTASTSTTTGSGIFAGGVGIAGALWVGSSINAVNGSTFGTSTFFNHLDIRNTSNANVRLTSPSDTGFGVTLDGASTNALLVTTTATTVAGNITVSGTGTSNIAGVLAMGSAIATSATAGEIVLANTYGVRSVNAAGTDTKVLMRLSSSNLVQIDPQGLGSTFNGQPTSLTTDFATSATGTGLTMHGGGTVRGASGSVDLLAAGSNKNVTLTASGSGSVTSASPVSLTNATASTSTSTGALVLSGSSAGLGMLGNLWVGGTGNFAGKISSTVTSGEVIAMLSGTTGALYADFANTGGTLVFGTESSTGGSLYSGTTAYAGIIGTSSGRPLQFLTQAGLALTIGAGAHDASFASTTEATTGGAGSVTTPGGFFATKKIISASSYTSGAPTAGSAGAWKLGAAITSSGLLVSTTQTIRVNVDGTDYSLAVLTTNP